MDVEDKIEPYNDRIIDNKGTRMRRRMGRRRRMMMMNDAILCYTIFLHDALTTDVATM